MANSRRGSSPPPPERAEPELRGTRADAEAALDKQIDEGRQLLEWHVASDHDYQNLDHEHSAWTGFNVELLGRMFTTNHYKFLYGQPMGYSMPMYPTFRSREQLLKETFIAEQISRLTAIQRRLPLIPEVDRKATTPAPTLPAVDADLFAWIDDASLRSTVATDYLEAQLALQVGANKAAAIMGASALEGMFLEALRRESVKSRPGYDQATKRLRQGGQEIVWGRAQLDELVKAAVALRLIAERMALHGQAARDARDTVHAYNELQKGRASAGEARILLELVPEAAIDLASHLAEA